MMNIDATIQIYINDIYNMLIKNKNIDDVKINYNEPLKSLEIEIMQKDLISHRLISLYELEKTPIDVICKNILNNLLNNKPLNYKDKLKAIFDKHGISNQLKKLSEEVFELQEAILRFEEAYSRFEVDDCYDCFIDDITKEFADVMVLLNQIKAIYNLDEKEIKDTMKYKIDRQCKRDGIDGNS